MNSQDVFAVLIVFCAAGYLIHRAWRRLAGGTGGGCGSNCSQSCGIEHQQVNKERAFVGIEQLTDAGSPTGSPSQLTSRS